MKRTRTIISFTEDTYRRIGNTMRTWLASNNPMYVFEHTHGIVTLSLNGKVNTDILPIAHSDIAFVYYEDTILPEIGNGLIQQDDPNDVVDCMSHCLSGLIDY